jgi:arylsulfatase A-like enzyme
MPGYANMNRPNLLFFLPDQHRPDFVGTNRSLPVRTPHFDQLAAQGMQFTHAFTPSPLCAPARACLASGMDYDHCGVEGNQVDYPLAQPTYYAALRRQGYHVAGVGKFDLHKATCDWGLDGSRLLTDWGFSEGIDNEGKLDAVRSGAERPKGPYMAYLHRRGLADIHVRDLNARKSYADTYPTPLPEDAYCDTWVAENGLRLLRDFPADQPWHLVVNFTGPHNPMDVTSAMQQRWQDVDFPPPHANEQFDAKTHRQIRRNYAAMIENIDRHVGRFLRAVEARGEMERTLIVFSSDHGEMLGDHNLWGKKSYYQPSVGVPLVVSGPGVQGGVVSTALVLLHDLAATFLDVAGADPLPNMEARSLLPLLAGEQETHRPVITSALENWRMVFDGRYKLVLFDTGLTLLFDRWEDPYEDTNLAEHLPGEVERLRLSLSPRSKGEDIKY